MFLQVIWQWSRRPASVLELSRNRRATPHKHVTYPVIVRLYTARAMDDPPDECPTLVAQEPGGGVTESRPAPTAPAEVPSAPMLLAHSPHVTGREPQALENHLRGVADRASAFVEPFADRAWGEVLGLWHDMGKAAPDWQAYIRAAMQADEDDSESPNGRVSHAPLGAIHASSHYSKRWEASALASAIRGHHGGMLDFEDPRSVLRNAEHRRRLELAKAALANSTGLIPPDLAPALRSPVHAGASKRSLELFTRFVFSALVDADALDAEKYAAASGDPESAGRVSARGFSWPTLSAYDETLTVFMAQKAQSAPDTPVNRLRGRVLAECVAASSSAPGAFTLTGTRLVAARPSRASRSPSSTPSPPAASAS